MSNQDHRPVNTSGFKTMKDYFSYQMQPYQNLFVETTWGGATSRPSGYRLNTQDNNYALARDLNSDEAQIANNKMCKKY